MLVDDLILTKKIGKGAYAEVFLSNKVGNNKLLATKRFNRAFVEKPQNLKRLLNEVSILRKYKHPNIIELIETKKTKSHCYLVTEYANGGDLYENLKKYKKIYNTAFPEKIVQHLMKQILNAIYFLHSHKIIHRDLKLENILVNFPTEQDKISLNMLNATIKIIDFGFATKLRGSDVTFSVLGSPSNMDPKLLKYVDTNEYNRYGYDEKVDIWSLGALCYEMLTDHLTFDGQSVEELKQNVKKGKYLLPLNLSMECVLFLNGMLQFEPNKRLSAKELLNQDFIVKNRKYFHYIDKNKIINNIKGNALIIDIKNSDNIFKLYNQEDQKNIFNTNNDFNIQHTNFVPYQQNNKIYQKNTEIYPQIVEISEPKSNFYLNNGQNFLQNYDNIPSSNQNNEINQKNNELFKTNHEMLKHKNTMLPKQNKEIFLKQYYEQIPQYNNYNINPTKNDNQINNNIENYTRITHIISNKNKNYQRQFTYDPPQQNFIIPDQISGIHEKKVEKPQMQKKEERLKEDKKEEDDDDILKDIPMEYTYYGNGFNNS